MVRRLRDDSGSVVNRRGEVLLSIYDCPDKVEQIHRLEQLEVPDEIGFAAHAFVRGGKPITISPVISDRWERALLETVAIVVDEGHLRLPDEFIPGQHNVRLIDLEDRQMVFATKRGLQDHLVIAAIREEFKKSVDDGEDGKKDVIVQLWRPMAHEYTPKLHVTSPGTALLMALQNLIEKGVWV